MSNKKWHAKPPYDRRTITRSACFLNENPGFHTSLSLRGLLSSNYDNKVKHYCRCLAMMGYVEVRVGYIRGNRWGASPEIMFDGDPRNVPGIQFVVGYAGTKKLAEDLESGVIKRLFIDEPKKRATVPVNKRIITTLTAKHPEELTFAELKAEIGTSESIPALLHRLTQLQEMDWITITDSQHQWFMKGWKVTLSSGGWLRTTQFAKDGRELKIPRTTKRPVEKQDG